MVRRWQFPCHAVMDIKRLVGENVRNYRLRAGLSQEELAAQMGVEQGYVSKLEAGARNPTIVTIWQTSEALGVQPAALFEVPSHSLKGRRARRRKSPR
jgi:transcriptional regulator with XRE-family HTH domain